MHFYIYTFTYTSFYKPILVPLSVQNPHPNQQPRDPPPLQPPTLQFKLPLRCATPVNPSNPPVGPLVDPFPAWSAPGVGTRVRRRCGPEPLHDQNPQMDSFLGAGSDDDVRSGRWVRDARAGDGKVPPPPIAGMSVWLSMKWEEISAVYAVPPNVKTGARVSMGV